MKVINYFSLDIFQRLQRWRTSEDVNDSSIPRSRPWRKATEKVSPDIRPVVSAWHTKMVAQTPHDTPAPTRQPCALSPDYQRRGMRQAELPSWEPQTARLLLVRTPDFVAAHDGCANRARVCATGTLHARLSYRSRRYGYSRIFWPSSPRAMPYELCPCTRN
jgi:hypothetical protein